MKHYTYIHQKTDDNKIFYIGKGQGNRAFSNNRRNNFWQSIAKKHGFNAEIIAYWKTEQEALAHEMLLISCFKDMGYKLANMTNGGEGSTGLKQSKETKEKRSLALTGKKRPDVSEFMQKFKKGTKHSEESKAKIKASAIARGTNYQLGKKHSEETKAKMRLSALARDKSKRNINGLKNQNKEVL